MTGAFFSVPRYDWCTPFSHPSPLWIMDPHSRAAKKNTSHGNEVLPQDTMHLTQRPCYQGSPCQHPTGNRTTQRPPDHLNETQTAVVWTSLPFFRSGQNHHNWKVGWIKISRFALFNFLLSGELCFWFLQYTVPLKAHLSNNWSDVSWLVKQTFICELRNVFRSAVT